MEATIQALGQILLRAIPTLLFLILIHFYLKAMFYRPLQKVLAQRREATEGARQAAEASLKSAAEKVAAFEQSLREARAEIYRQQEEVRRQWLEEQTARLDDVRQQSRAMIQEASVQLNTEKEAAKRDLGTYADSLAEQIAQSIVSGRVA
jgi:F-type H+-transporting ATPase subunit b